MYCAKLKFISSSFSFTNHHENRRNSFYSKLSPFHTPLNDPVFNFIQITGKIKPSFGAFVKYTVEK